MEQLNCLRCTYRHEDNGNCTAAGGFCTAVPAAHCRLLQEYLGTGLTPDGVEALKLSMMGKAVAEIKGFDGLPIDRLKELAEADKEGRVAVLPCKVGDMVWVPASDRLPAQDGQYLCLYSFPTGGHARSVLRPSVLDYYATDARPHFQYEGYRGMHVSYWMPLPPVPEVDDG